VGVELAGVSGPEGDLELLAVAADAMRGAGLEDFTIDIGDAGIVRALLAGIEPAIAEQISQALVRKDDAELESFKSVPHVDRLRALTRLHGAREAVAEGEKLLAGTAAESAVARLAEVFDKASARGLGPQLTADLGEVRGFAYYTGPIFHLYAPGPGEAIGSGGRYDELLARFGAPMPAVGFAVDLDLLAWALKKAEITHAPAPRIVLVGGEGDPRLGVMRAGGVACCAHAREGALDYARAWGFTHVLDGGTLTEVATGAVSPSPYGGA
jgi:ATP phosphoribosyltransferase regulatory subunit